MSDPVDPEPQVPTEPSVEIRPRFEKGRKVRYQRQELEVLEVHPEGLRLPGYAGFVDRAACAPL